MGRCRPALAGSAIPRVLLALGLVAALRPAAAAQAWPGVPIGAYWSVPVEGHLKALAVVDLEGDGWSEVIGGTDTGQVLAWTAEGQVLWQFRVETEWVAQISSADLDRDGRLEVLVIAAGILPTRYLYVLRADGSLWWSHQVREDLWHAVATDLDGDPGLEVLLAARRPAALDSDGSPYPGWPADLLQTPLVRLADWDGDGGQEVVALGPDSLNIVDPDGIRQAYALPMPEAARAMEPVDLDGDGRLELAVQTDSHLLLLGHDGQVLWARPQSEAQGGPLLATTEAGGGALLVFADAMALEAVDSAGQVRWSFRLERAGASPATLSTARRLILVGTSAGRVYLLDRAGQALAQYDLEAPAGAAQVTDLNGDGYSEVLLAAGGWLSLYGAPAGPASIRQRWSTPTQQPVAALAAGDVNEDGRPEILVGSTGATLLDAAGRRLWQTPPYAAAGGSLLDPLGGILEWSGNSLRRQDGRGLVLWQASASGAIRAAVATQRSAAVVNSAGQIELFSLSDGARLASPRLASPVLYLAADASDVVALTQSGQVVRFSSGGSQLWAIEVGQPADAVVLANDGSVLARAADQLIELDEAGAIRWAWKTQAPERITAVGQSRNGVVVGTDVRVVVLDQAGAEVLSHSLGEVISAVASADIDGDGAEDVIAGTVQGWVVVLAPSGQPIWQGEGRERVNRLTTADLDGDGGPEILAGFEDGAVAAYGDVLSQAPWLGAPSVTAVGSGFQYAVNVRDPAGDSVTVFLEIWDPSAQRWQAQGAASAAGGTGTLTWNLSQPFDTWDAGQDSAFRFTWSGGDHTGQTAAFSGPLRISVAPWYVTYGRAAGLIALLLAVPALLLVLAWRVRAHRRSPLGQAEAALLRLMLDPDEMLIELRRLLADEARALPLLAHLPGLAREARQPALADLLEAAYLALTRPELIPEALRSTSTALGALGPDPRIEAMRQAYALLSAAMSVRAVADIVSLGPSLEGLSQHAPHDPALVQPISPVLERLCGVPRTLQAAEQLDDLGDQILYLAEAAADLQLIQQRAHAELSGLDRRAIEAVVRHWADIVAESLQQVRGRAELHLELAARQLVMHEAVSVRVAVTNRGRSPATNVSVEFCPGEGLVPLQPAQLATLSAGVTERLELPARTMGLAGWRAITFRATWDDRAQQCRSAEFTERIRLVAAPRLYTPIPNPYSTGRPLPAGSPLFVGRNDITDFIAEKLAGEHLVVLVGERRAGKTSLLQQLAARLGEGWVTAYLDGQSLGVEGGLRGWLADAALEIARACGGADRRPAPPDFGPQPGPTFEAYLQRLAGELPAGRRLLILLDEFEEIEARVSAGDLPPAIFPYLRHLFQAGEVRFLLAGTHRLEILSPHFWSPLFNIGVYQEVGPLDDAAARHLIVAPIEGHLLYDDLAVDKLLRLSGSQPYFLQLLCHCVVSLCNRQQLPYATVSEIDQATTDALSLGQAHLRFLSASATAEEQALLRILARLVAEGETRTIQAIGPGLARCGIDASRAPALIARSISHSLVRRLPSGQYDFAADIVRLWVERAGS